MEQTKRKQIGKPLQNIAYCYKRLIRYCGKKHALVLPLLILTAVGVPLLFAILPSVAIKGLVSDVGTARLFAYLGTYIAFLCVMQFTLQRLNLVVMRETFIFRILLSKEFGAKTIGVPYEYLESVQGKENIQKASIAVYAGNNFGVEAMINLAVKLVINSLGFCVYALVGASLNPWIMVVLTVSPLIRLWLANKNRVWKEKTKQEWTPLEVKINYLNTSCLELKNGKDIRMYQIEGWFTKLYRDLVDKRCTFYKKEDTREWFVQFVDRLIGCIRDVICYGYLIYQVFQGMDIALFTLYLGIIVGFSEWLFKIADDYNQLLDNNVIINDYRKFIEEENYWEKGGNTPLPEAFTHTLTVENVSYTYPGTEAPVFENLNLTIQKGEKLAIVGMNGCGKSTLIKLICGLYQPQKGRILLDGMDIREFNLKEYYDKYAVVFQDVFAFAFPIGENVTCGMTKENQEELIERCLEESGLKEKVFTLPKGANTSMLKDLEEDGVNFSGGELQKLMLARALYKDASMLILDEPTAALDPIAEAEMYQKYNVFTQGKTSIFISHRLSSTQFCDRIIFLEDGKIIEDGTHDTLLRAEGAYAHMYKLQAHYYQEEVEETCMLK